MLSNLGAAGPVSLLGSAAFTACPFESTVRLRSLTTSVDAFNGHGWEALDQGENAPPRASA